MNRNKNKFNLSETLITSVIVVFLVGFSLLSVWIVRGLSSFDPAAKPSEESSSQSESSEESSEPSYAEGEGDIQQQESHTSETVDMDKYTILDIANEQIHRGDLILINGENEYIFSEEDVFTPIYGNKNKAYVVAYSTITLNEPTLTALNAFMLDFNEATGRRNIQVTSGVRTFENQQKLYNTRVNQQGEEAASKFTAKPGHSEHHSGYAVDFNLYMQNGNKDLTNEGDYTWIYEHAHEYGFIQRYFDEKADLTGISDEPWHFRYVGVPHAAIMTERGYCLEEYMQYVYGFPFGVSHLTTEDAEGTQYEIYYVAANTSGKTTSVPVPNSGSYTVSGNNVDGFIVTVVK
ncbi:MAG: M15 family metallopeptidase [Oscillospiraceae bacterium]|nr:M15 family metallopeptidase [Oscillospiraceae bacterium]MBQ9938287.1 M15 family metallopeptidase [Oscillospiraceae bacterium]